MSWFTSPDAGRSRIFLYLGLTAVFLLASYQLILNRELLGSVADWATETAFPSLADSSGDENGNGNGNGNATENEIATAIGAVNVTIPTSSESIKIAPTETPAVPVPREKELVLAAMRSSNMSWVSDHLPGWYTNIYRADASPEEANLTVPANRGNEAMVYLTYVHPRKTRTTP